MSNQPIVFATLYNYYGGSVMILVAGYQEVSKKINTILRAPLKEASHKMPYFYSPESLIGLRKKVLFIPILLEGIYREYRFIKKIAPKLIYVNDELSLYTYGIVGKLLKIPVIWNVQMSEGRSKLQKKLRNWLCADKVYVSDFSVENPNEPYTIIRNPAIISKEIKVEKKNLAQKENIEIYIIGSICDNKNQLLGMELIEKLNSIEKEKKFYLRMCGNIIESSYFEKIMEIVKEKNLENFVTYEGFKTKEEIYSEADLVLIPSKHESFGMVFIEALYSGVPVVASKIPSFVEISRLIGYDKQFLFAFDKTANNVVDAIYFVFHQGKNEHVYRKDIEKFFGLNVFGENLNKFFTSMNYADY